ncbi:MAG: M48 family metallopeptidase [Sedimentisphaerales bacterium]|nr:M48 family metallopeptidase [Sedimentisphaerales bacterium]
MSKLFYNLGRKVGPKVRKAKWIWQSMTGTEADAIKVENDVGRDLAHEIRLQLKPDRDQQTQKLLADIAPRLTSCVANKYRTFSFEVVEGGEPNAFALPGGFIFITNSIVELCGSRTDEIAFILAHEMAHVIRGHAMNRIISNTAISTAAKVTPIRGVLAGWLRKVGIQFLESAYSQDLESEADNLGVRLAAAAGYAPKAATTLLERLDKLTRPPQKICLGHYFSTHPACKTRIEAINRLISKLQELKTVCQGTHPRHSIPG